jgi:hypothetical protein
MSDDLMELLQGSGVEDIIMPRSAFIKEHKKLIGVLRRGNPAELKKEAAEQGAELQKQLSGGRGPSAWITALKEWNGKSPGTWCVPRKGSSAYDEVREIFTRLKEGQPPKEPKGRKAKAAKEAEEQASKERAAEERMEQRAEEVAVRRGEEAKARRKEEALKKVRKYAQGIREKTSFCADKKDDISKLIPTDEELKLFQELNLKTGFDTKTVYDYDKIYKALETFSNGLTPQELELIKKCQPSSLQTILEKRKQIRISRVVFERFNTLYYGKKYERKKLQKTFLLDDDYKDSRKELLSPSLSNKHERNSLERIAMRNFDLLPREMKERIKRKREEIKGNKEAEEQLRKEALQRYQEQVALSELIFKNQYKVKKNWDAAPLAMKEAIRDKLDELHNPQKSNLLEILYTYDPVFAASIENKAYPKTIADFYNKTNPRRKLLFRYN